MKTRRPLAILAATAITGLGLTALATPASANTTVTIGGEWQSTGTAPNKAYTTGEASISPLSIQQDSPPTFSGTSIIVSVASGTKFDGAPLTLVVFSDELTSLQGSVCDDETACTVDIGGSAEFIITQNAIESEVRIASNQAAILRSLFDNVPLFFVSYQAPAVTNSGPAPVLQQFEKPATGTCDEAQPEGLNWGGASSGGWSESWAQWTHEGQGGPVCTRTLAYNNSTGTWQVQ